MEKEVRAAAFEGRTLRLLAGEETGREVVLGLPLSRLLVKLVRVPAGKDAAEFAKPVLKAISPTPDDDLTVGVETVSEDAEGSVVIAAALLEGISDDIGEALDAQKLSVVKIDALILGQLRGIWSALGDGKGDVRRLVLVGTVDGISLIAIDGDLPVAIRAMGATGELKREVMLSLLEAEDFGGAKKLGEIVVVGEVPVEGLEAFAPIRKIEVGEDAALAGVRERGLEPGSLNVLPESWREVLDETRFKAKLVRNLAVAGGIWALAMGVMFGVPIAYGYMTDYQKGLARAHNRQYTAVRDMKEKTELVQKYSDHARGALEIMKAVSDRLPEGIELSSWNFKREEGVSVAGEAADASAVYAFKDAMEQIGAEDGDESAERVFGAVDLGGLTASKTGQRFTIDCRYAGEEEE